MDTYVENRHGIRKMINRAYVVMVAVDQEHHPWKFPDFWWNLNQIKQNGKAEKSDMRCENSGEWKDFKRIFL